jgi:pantoate--beta-alanine ligase
MGALHEGHLSLIRKAKQENDIVVASIFVNPKQFGEKEDYNRYPKDIAQDKIRAKTAGCDILFCPDQASMYPDDFSTYVEVKDLSDCMCSLQRPGHFKAVATVCLKLFNIVLPHRAYFGAKDYQQALIVKRMVSDLDMNLRIKVLPTIRERSGLAMSSRNRYLNQAQQNQAALLYKSLRHARYMISSGQREAAKIDAAMRDILEQPGVSIDYISIVDPNNLNALERVREKALIAVAVRIGSARLIDNVLIRTKNPKKE